MVKSNVFVRVVRHSDPLFKLCVDVRMEVFVNEQKVPAENECIQQES